MAHAEVPAGEYSGVALVDKADDTQPLLSLLQGALPLRNTRPLNPSALMLASGSTVLRLLSRRHGGPAYSHQQWVLRRLDLAMCR